MPLGESLHWLRNAFAVALYFLQAKKIEFFWTEWAKFDDENSGMPNTEANVDAYKLVDKMLAILSDILLIWLRLLNNLTIGIGIYALIHIAESGIPLCEESQVLLVPIPAHIAKWNIHQSAPVAWLLN